MDWIKEQQEILRYWKLLYGFNPTHQEILEVKRKRDRFKQQQEQDTELDPERLF